MAFVLAMVFLVLLARKLVRASPMGRRVVWPLAFSGMFPRRPVRGANGALRRARELVDEPDVVLDRGDCTSVGSRCARGRPALGAKRALGCRRSRRRARAHTAWLGARRPGADAGIHPSRWRSGFPSGTRTSMVTGSRSTCPQLIPIGPSLSSARRSLRSPRSSTTHRFSSDRGCSGLRARRLGSRSRTSGCRPSCGYNSRRCARAVPGSSRRAMRSGVVSSETSTTVRSSACSGSGSRCSSLASSSGRERTAPPSC